ncbi:hypothetical protein [Niabella beijingensis]|uniref:hypothetical protein n=1 Tax=Niabella beijingensis TaxID=2872700 RepID=UPI001CBE1668|nr:hypothetical protein [Niabella beijingensis]MBZ4191195.1 hypothetical protein [Niabella beijingensis]
MNSVWYCYGLLWLLVHLFRSRGHPLPFVNGQLTDFLFIPVVAPVALSIIRRYVVHNGSYNFPLWQLLITAGYVSVVFEGILPHYLPAYTADAGDVAAYFLGSLYYYYVHQRCFLSGRKFSVI